jgi:hypothetical protein
LSSPPSSFRFALVSRSAPTLFRIRTSSAALADAAAGVFRVNGRRQLTTAETTSQLCVHECTEILLGSTALYCLDFTPHDLFRVRGRHAPTP